ncbi:MAG: type III secretion system chaperone [Candidatus Competibacteraceae bacterium]|nr:type III secretion system chaperone [Candidatus Competibacteraceae bacterium]
MSLENAQAVLAELGVQMGIDQLTFNGEGLCSIGLDDFILNIELTTNGETLTLTAWLAEIPEGRRSEAAQRIADANYLFYGTQGATLGMNRNTGDVVLAVRMPTMGLPDWQYFLMRSSCVPFSFMRRVNSTITSHVSRFSSPGRSLSVLRIACVHLIG